MEEMGVLTELRLEDLPGWEGSKPIRLAPLTLFFGGNGSGKTALVRAVCDTPPGRRPRLLARRCRRGDRDVEERLGRWLTGMGVIDEFSVVESRENVNVWGLRVKTRGSEECVPLPHAGTGAQRALLVLVRAFARETNAPVHLEHPESHLQPSAQSALGDALLEAVRAPGAQLLVETHSERLLRRIQRRIAEGQVASDVVAAYFIGARAGEPEVSELAIDDYGDIGNWPREFFADEVSDLAATAEAAARRRAGAWPGPALPHPANIGS